MKRAQSTEEKRHIIIFTKVKQSTPPGERIAGSTPAAGFSRNYKQSKRKEEKKMEKNYKMVDGYEIDPYTITDKLVTLANIDTTKDTFDTTRQQLTDALYYLDAVCQNRYNNDYFRTLYNTLATIAENTEFKKRGAKI